MARKNRIADAASSILAGVATFALILGLLLTPNVVIADDNPTPSPVSFVAVCTGCGATSTCGGTTNCLRANGNTCVVPVTGGCQDANGAGCLCGDKVTPMSCACEG